MEFCLVSDKTILFQDFLYNNREFMRKANHKIPVCLQPVTTNSVGSQNYISALLRVLEEASKIDCTREVTDTSDVLSKCNYQLVATLCIPMSLPGEGRIDVFAGESGTSIFDALARIFNGNNLRFSLKLTKVTTSYSCTITEYRDVVLNGLQYDNLRKRVTTDEIFFLESHGRDCLNYRRRVWNNNETIKCNLTLAVQIGNPALVKTMLSYEQWTTVTEKNKQMLQDGVGSDLVVITEDDFKMHCHKSILIASSKVFQAMFGNKMKEESSNHLVIKDMSTESFQAFVEFLYTHELKNSQKMTCSTVYELYQAAHKYGINQPISPIIRLLLLNNNDWYSVDMVIDLLVLTTNIFDDDPEVKQLILGKIAQVIKWKCKFSLESMLLSDSYKTLCSPKYTQLIIDILALT